MQKINLSQKQAEIVNLGEGAFLIEASAGSGKTNSISWLSHRLANLHNEKDENVFRIKYRKEFSFKI